MTDKGLLINIDDRGRSGILSCLHDEMPIYGNNIITKWSDTIIFNANEKIV